MNKHIHNIILIMVLITMALCPLLAQNTQIIVADQAPFTPESLIRNFFIGEGVQILDINFEGKAEATGYFSNGLQDIGIEQGIVIGTGEVEKIDRPSSSESSTLTSNLEVVDKELEDIIGATVLKDIASFEITFIPSADTVQFNYVFASEEYPEYVCSNFNDVFGFFISGPNPSGGDYNSQNIAIVPGTTNLPVSINNVNSGMAGSSGNQANCQSIANLNFSEFYNTNNSEHLTFDGILDPFIAAAKVVPCETYTIKFSIGDASDFLKDSAVFLEGKSFSSNTVQVKAVTVSANGTITEGCADATILFELPGPTAQPEVITFEIIGTAENGIDFDQLGTNITIQPGQSSAELNILPFEDNLVEDIESLGIVITKGSCTTDTIWLGIEDNYLIPPPTQEDLFLCDNPTQQVDFTIPFVAPAPIVFRNQNDIRIDPVFEPVFSTIKVENIFPSTLNQTDFIQVCIDDLSHPWIDDLSIYLFGPDDQFIELTSKNGGNGGNGTGLDFYLNTCFTFDASQMIEDPANQPPYIGAFQPEGNWDDLFASSSYKANGNWRLMMIDDFQGSVGTLHSWSIHFGQSYDINYAWSPNIGISCTDCPNPTFNPSESQLYTLDIEDTNGCSLQYEVMVNAAGTPLNTPIVICQNEATNTLTFSWDIVAEAESYNIRINGRDWISVDQDLTYTESGLSAGTSITIEVQAVGACAESAITEVTCSTVDCVLSLNLNTQNDPNCETLNSGLIIVEAIGGAEPYTYQFGDVANITGLFENLIGGEHEISVVDNNDCQSNLTVTLNSKEEIVISGAIINASCEEETGSIDLSVSGGIGELTLSWSDNFTGDLSILTPGTYTLTVTDEEGCLGERDFIIQKVADFEVQFNITEPDCANEASGSIIVETNDQALIQDIVWSNGIQGLENNNLIAGPYTVIITNQDGCELVQQFVLESSSQLTSEILHGDVFCQGESNGFVTITATGGTEPIDVLWSNGVNGNQLSDLVAGTYSAIITDANSCLLFDTVVISEPLPLSINEIEIDPPNCERMTGTLFVSPSGGSAPYMYSINNQDYTESSIFTDLVAGDYIIAVVDSYGCDVTSTQSISIPEVEEIELIIEPFITLGLGDSIRLNAFVPNRNDQLLYEWTTPDSSLLSCTNCENPILYGISPSTIEIQVTDETGCTAISFITVQVDSAADIYVPNAFSPNSDGINDFLTVFGKETVISEISEFSIYDRWGNQIMSTQDMRINTLNDGWNGKFRGVDMNNGVFVWHLTVIFIDGRKEHFSGDVTLIR